jgi:serine/threonine-protein kinase RsbW
VTDDTSAVGDHDATIAEADRIEFRMPSDPRFIRVARLAASGIGAGAGLDIDRIEDLKIAVGEVCATLIEIGDGGPVTLGLGVMPSGDVRVEGRVPVGVGTSPDRARFALTEQILHVIAGGHDFVKAGDAASLSFNVSPTPHGLGAVGDPAVGGASGAPLD